MGTEFPNGPPRFAHRFRRRALSGTGQPLPLRGKPLDLRPELLETFLPHQFLKVTALAEIRVKFLRDQAAQHVEAIVAFAASVALCFQKLLGSQRPRFPFLPLSDHRLASIPKAPDLGAQRVA